MRDFEPPCTHVQYNQVSNKLYFGSVCGCDTLGSQHVTACNELSGQCQCRPFVEGKILLCFQLF